ECDPRRDPGSPTDRYIITVLMQLTGVSLAVILSMHAVKDVPLTADPNSAFWKSAKPIYATGDTMGKNVPGHGTEIRSRWTADNVYFLFICPYQELYPKPDPVTDKETNKLWNYDVAEVFVGWDYKNIHRYKEF